MKKVKRLLSLALTLAIAVTMFAGVTALADEPVLGAESTPKGSITINNATIGQEYHLHKMLDLTYNGDPLNPSYSYTIAEGWEEFFYKQNDNANTGTGADFVEIDKLGHVTWKGTLKQSDFIIAAKAYVNYKANTISGIPGIKIPTRTEQAENQSAGTATYIYEGLDLGYYFVDSTVGTLCSLTSTAFDSVISDKNIKPSIEKRVKEDANGFTSVNDADIGQDILFDISFVIKNGAENYIVHDRMDEGLDFVMDGDHKFKVWAGAGASDKTDAALQTSGYKIVTTEEDGHSPLEDGCAFHVVFDNAFVKNYNFMDKSVYIEYYGRLNEKAVIGDDGNVNTTWLNYGKNNDLETTPSTTTTKTWEFQIDKYTGENTPLAGAEFYLCKPKSGSSSTSVEATEDGEGALYAKVVKEDAEKNEYKFVSWGSKAEATVLMTSGTGENHNIRVVGIDGDIYFVREENAPQGYNKLIDDQKVTIVDTNNKTAGWNPGEVRVNTENTLVDTGVVRIQNNKGAVLPETGGMGTTIFYTIGGLLVIGAGVILVTRRRVGR